jgi:transposase
LSVARRCRIVLQCADGYTNREVARHLGVSEGTVATWRARYLAGGLEAMRDRPRPGVDRSISDEQVQGVIARTLTEPPPAGPAWTRPAMAQVSGISRSSVGRIWTEHGIHPRRANIVALSADPAFVDQVRDVVGLYFNPPQGALALCCDELLAVPEARRATPFRARPAGPAGASADDAVTGSSDLQRALAAALAQGIADPNTATTIDRDRDDQFEGFLEGIAQAVPEDLAVHVVLAPSVDLMSESLCQWRLDHLWFEFHPTPTDAWWIAVVEGWLAGFAALGLGRSTTELVAAINAWIKQWNEHPRRFVWHKNEDEIVQMLFP